MATKPKTILQAGAIPFRNSKVCLITSSSGKRWVIPKGCLEPGKTVSDIALQEAWEEAGLRGILHSEPIGSYLYAKCGDTYQVTVFVMEVSTVAEDWPERTMRRRRWLPAPQVLSRIVDPGLRKVLRIALYRAARLEIYS